MASKEDFESMLGRAVVDQPFRQQLTSDPSSAARSMGIDLTDEQQQALASAGSDLQAGAEDLERRLAKWHAIVGGTPLLGATDVANPGLQTSFGNVWSAGAINEGRIGP